MRHNDTGMERFFALFLLSNDKVMVLLNLAKNESYPKDSDELNTVQRQQ